MLSRCSPDYQTMRPHKEQGSVVIKASIERYKSFVFAKQSKKPQVGTRKKG